jgi:RNA polymerase sigma factor (sigma-70 family)
VGGDDSKIPERYAAEITGFFKAYAPWLAGHAFWRTSRDRELAASRELAADLVQDTFEAAALAWETLRELTETQQKAWLRTTLSHKETSNFRRRVAFRRKQPKLHYKSQAAAADTEQQALSAIALERATEIIEDLPGKQKRIALMKWNDHMSGAEIAAELGCAEGTVAAQIHEIRRKLIDGLGPYYPFAEDDGEGGAPR